MEDIKEKILREKTLPLQDRVKELESSVNNYKHLLDDIEKRRKSSVQKYKDEARNLNEEKKDLLNQLKSKNTDETALKRKFIENENKFSLLQQKYDHLFETSKNDIENLVAEREEILAREKLLIDEIDYKKSRIEAKDKEVGEYTKQIENLNQQIEDAYSKISKNDFYKDQYTKLDLKYNKLSSDYNDLAHKSNQTKLDRDELEL